jgi:uncharacterized protein YbbK (DUF523 family)
MAETKTAKILVSACLLGRPVRYNGSAKPLAHPALERWQSEGRLVAICPELTAGFSVPRPPAEIAQGKSGEDVLAETAGVIEHGDTDVTDLYLAGARAALDMAHAQNCRFALLIDGSPSCGSRFIHNGDFDGAIHAGAGVTAALLRANGITVFADSEIEGLEQAIDAAD